MIGNISRALKNAPLLGAIMTWDLRAQDVTRDDIRTALMGLVDVPDVWPEGAFRRAMRKVGSQNLTAQIVKNDEGALVYAIAKPVVEDDVRVGDSAGEVVNRVLWRRCPQGDQEQYVFEVHDDLAEMITSRYDFLTKHVTTDEVREIVKRVLLSWGAIKIHGRMYYVKASHFDEVTALKKALAEIDSLLYMIPVPDVDESKEFVGHAAKHQVILDVQKLQAEIEKWKDGSRVPRPATLQQRLERYEDLKANAEMLADVLSLQIDDITQAVNEMAGQVADLLGIEPEEEDEEEDLYESGIDRLLTDDPSPPPTPVVPTENGLSSKTVKELKKIAKGYGIRPGRLSKAALVAAIQEVIQ